MGFLDNSGDIILDAVLTDAGRKRMAQGDGSFNIAKFALGDDEIDYSLYRNSNHPNGAHPSGSAYYDLEIMQTPVLEAFTNNASSMKSKLMSFPVGQLLYLPILKVNDGYIKDVYQKTPNHNWPWSDTTNPANLAGTYMVAVNSVTAKAFEHNTITGVMNGANPAGSVQRIWIDQGIDNEDKVNGLEPGLVETQYFIEIDNRLGKIVDMAGGAANHLFTDDDQIATYAIDSSMRNFYMNMTGNNKEWDDLSDGPNLKGKARGSSIMFKIASQNEVLQGKHLFELIGQKWTSATFPTVIGASVASEIAANNLTQVSTDGKLWYIDSPIRVIGNLTGYRLDLVIRYVLCETCSLTG